ncbi:unnamed protein product [Calicophoron daubneyi]|uniref:Calcium uniporter protein n=1 Tax=Calicophoron daubneyi TaxID=300641 RepID=A0AAV2TCS7_CALDB
MTIRGLVLQRCLKKTFDSVRPQLNIRSYSSTSVVSAEPVSVNLENGFPRFCIPLPSRKETCIFTVKPLQHTVGDLVNFIKSEDHGVDHVTFLNKDGLRIAKSNSIADLLSSEFQLVINDEKFSVDTSALPPNLTSSCPKDLSDVRMLITRLATTVHSEEFQLQQQRELERRIEDISVQLEPFEVKRKALALDAAKRTRRLTWLGLGYMGIQFGLLARLTWWEYSWDIMEPVTYFVGYGTTMAMYAYYVITRQDYSFPQVFDREYLKRFYKIADRTAFDVERYNELSEQLAELKSELRRLRDPLLCNLPLQQTGYIIPEKAERMIETGPPRLPNGGNSPSLDHKK